MAARDRRIDAYIARSEEFARPILVYLRECVHEACPQVEETIKWGAPSFVHAGGILCGMAAFKRHASFGYWRHAEVMGGGNGSRVGMGSYGKLVSLDGLPPRKRLLADIRRAVRLNEAGPGSAGPRGRRRTSPAPDVPPDLRDALAANPAAKSTFDAFAPSHRREYVEWIVEAKREDTRLRRVTQAVEWMAEGKPRNWKYARR